MTHRHFRSISLLPAFGLAFGLSACSSDGISGPDSSSDQQGVAQQPSQPGSSGPAPDKEVAKFEVRYMTFSIDHHTMGIRMAELCVNKAVHSELRDLCRRSIESQRREIDQLHTWLDQWYGFHYEPQMTKSDRRMLERLAALGGKEFEDRFLNEFSRHHLQIIRRSEKAVRRVYHEQLRELARNIVVQQSEDVAKMRRWDCEWYGDCRNEDDEDSDSDNG